jgi:predicted NBD/HSP70 family sugar kinase
MATRPGTPRLLRELNDRSALDLLVRSGPLTRAEIGRHTGLSKVTASQLLARLEERGLVAVVGEQAGGRGPNAALYAVVPSSAYVAGLEVGPNTVVAAIADITGNVVAEVTIDPNGADDPVSVIHSAVVKACRSGRIPLAKLHALVLGTPGVVDPRTGDVQFIFDLPHWHAGILEALRRDLRLPVTIENDVNLAALAEKADGAAKDTDDFALLWAARGLGLAVMLGGRLHRGVSGGAGEIGYLPVPGVPLPEKDTESVTWGMPALAGGLGALVGADAVRELAARHGFAGPTATGCVRAAAAAGESADAFLRELATRLAYGVASVTIVLDPELVVITGDLGRAGGDRLAELIEEAVGRICPTRPRVALTRVEGNPVLRGALLAALDRARDDVFSASPA